MFWDSFRSLFGDGLGCLGYFSYLFWDCLECFTACTFHVVLGCGG